ncbi:MAG: pyridoxal-phosphate dependent enzyme [Polyangiaceae bacterium]
MSAALLRVWPRLAGRVQTVELGAFPSPLERLDAIERELSRSSLYVKRDDLSSPVYGGNKVRTLEVLFGLALAEGAREVHAVGAYGSNHAVATVLHAPRAGLRGNVMLFPQPESLAALENLRVSAALSHRCVALPHWSFVPWAIWRTRRAGAFVMVPGGATPTGALGYVAAALEVAEQFQRAGLPAPAEIVVGIGSCCTSAGLLVGVLHAARQGLWRGKCPRIRAVRVSPWPVTSRFRVLSLALATSRHLATLSDDRSLELPRDELADALIIDGRELGAGYGRPSERGLSALELFGKAAGMPLDTTYSAKAAAGFLRAAREAKADAPLLFWSTKSSAPLPVPSEDELGRAPAAIRRYLERARPTTR